MVLTAISLLNGMAEVVVEKFVFVMGVEFTLVNAVPPIVRLYTLYVVFSGSCASFRQVTRMLLPLFTATTPRPSGCWRRCAEAGSEKAAMSRQARRIPNID